MVIMYTVIRRYAVLILCAVSWPASAAMLSYGGIIDSCEPKSVCDIFSVESGGGVEAYLVVPDGPTGPIPPGDITGFNPDAGVLFADGVLILIPPLGSLLGAVTDSTLVTDADNRLIKGKIEMLWTQRAVTGDEGSPILRTIVMMIDTSGSFTSVLRNGPITEPVVLTSTGSGEWDPPANIPDLGLSADLDTGFSTDGYSSGGTPIILLHPDGRILHIASSDTDTEISVSAQDESGNDIAGGGNADVSTGLDIARAAAIQSDGKIVVTGYSDSAGDEDIIATRFNQDLSLDTTFGSNGFVTLDVSDNVNSRAYGIGIQADDRILLAPGNIITAVSLVRLNADGSIDTAFGTAGEAFDASPGFSTGLNSRRIPVSADGKVYLAGIGLSSSSTDDDMAVIRFNPDGTFDTAFGENGTAAFVSIGADSANDIALQFDGKVVLAGSSGSGDTDLTIVRFDDTGNLDTSFNSSGVLTVDTGGISDSAFGVVVQPDGKIVFGGSGNPTVVSDLEAVIARVNADGTPDITFGSNGVFVNSALCCTGVYIPKAIQSNGRILAFADSAPGTTARFNGNGIDTLPDGLSFGNQFDTVLSSTVESEALMIEGLSDNIAVPVFVENGEYRVNAGEYASDRGFVRNGDTVQLRHVSSDMDLTKTVTTISLGGVSGAENYSIATGTDRPADFSSANKALVSNIAEATGAMDRLFMLLLICILVARTINFRADHGKQ